MSEEKTSNFEQESDMFAILREVFHDYDSQKTIDEIIDQKWTKYKASVPLFEHISKIARKRRDFGYLLKTSAALSYPQLFVLLMIAEQDGKFNEGSLKFILESFLFWLHPKNEKKYGSVARNFIPWSIPNNERRNRRNNEEQGCSWEDVKHYSIVV